MSIFLKGSALTVGHVGSVLTDLTSLRVTEVPKRQRSSCRAVSTFYGRRPPTLGGVLLATIGRSPPRNESAWLAKTCRAAGELAFCSLSSVYVLFPSIFFIFLLSFFALCLASGLEPAFPLTPTFPFPRGPSWLPPRWGRLNGTASWRVGLTPASENPDQRPHGKHERGT